MPEAMTAALRRLGDRGEVLLLGSVLLAVQLFPRRVPGGIYGLGLVAGSALAIHAIGLVLVFRASRIINFAQLQVGSLVASCFTLLTRPEYLPFFRLVRGVCPPCVERVTPALYRLNYGLAAAASLALAAAVGWAAHRFVVRRFAEAPPLVLTVATVPLAQLVAGVQALLPRLLLTPEQREFTLRTGPAPVPFDLTVRWAPARLHAPDLLTVAVAAAAAAGLALWLRRSATGVAVRGAADNPARVQTLGVNVDVVTRRVWTAAALLSGAAGILTAMSAGAPLGVSLNVNVFVRILAVAVVARMTSLPATALAAVAVGILDQAVLWAFGSTVVLDGLLVFVLGAVLLLQRHQASRAELEQAGAWRPAREVRPIPPQLGSLPVVRRWVQALRVGGAVVALGLPWALSPAQNELLAVLLISMIVGLSVLVLTGWAGQITLGQFAFAALGGYVTAVLHLPLPLALVGAGVAGAAAAVVVGVPALKLRGLHLAVTTMAFALSVSSLLLNPQYLGRHLPNVLDRPSVLGVDLDDQRAFVYLALAVLALATAGVAGIRRSRTARALIAARDNELAAQCFGINLVRTRLVAFAASGFLAALAGALFAFHQHGVKPQAFAPEQSVLLFLMAVTGGTGSVASPFLGVLAVGLPQVLGASATVLALLSGGGLLALLLVLPGGLGQAVYGVRDAILRRVAARHRIVVPGLTGEAGAVAAPILPRVRPGGGAVFVPRRYRLEGQWALGGGGTPPAGGGRG